MADYAVAELGDQTPLRYASTPNMDRLARMGVVGTVKTIPDGCQPASDIANLSVLGYDPRRYYTGRSPLEAISMGIAMAEGDVTLRCNLVTLSDEVDFPRKVMVDYSADEISTTEAAELIAELDRRLGNAQFSFHPGISYRHLILWRHGDAGVETTPPHDISDRVIGGHLPRGAQGNCLLDLMEVSNRFLPGHPVNQARQARGLRPANTIWLWGQGTKPMLPSFAEKYHLSGSVISAVDLVKGIGISTGMATVDVPGATGNINTDFTGKARAAIEELRRGQDFVFVHVEAPDEASHRGELQTKIKAIEEIDARVLGEILLGLEEFGAFRILVMPDHYTPLSLKTHTADEVPFLIYDHTSPQAETMTEFSEETARVSGIRFTSGCALMTWFLSRESTRA